MNIPPVPVQLAVRAVEAVCRPRAVALAAELGLPLIEPAAAGYPAQLVVTTERLELRMAALGGPVYADFSGRRRGGWRNHLIARAAGLKSGVRPNIVDASAGLGRDASLLARLGCPVMMLERSSLIGALLADALIRVARDGSELGARLRLRIGDSGWYLTQLAPDQRPDVVCLDPMYPDFGRTAQARKEMRMLRSLVGDDDDAPAVLASALRCATRRVVVKRPRLAPPLTGPRPSLTLTGSSTRFDVYLL